MSANRRDGRSELAVVVLAAGEGRRLGLGPKAHVPLGDESFLAHIVRGCREAGLDRLWVVGSALDTTMAAACSALSVELLLNPQPERGMSSSVQLGLRAAQREGPRGVVVFPVDLPLVSARTLTSLIAALHDDACVRPLHAGRHGHPIVLGTNLAAKLVAVDASIPLRDALDAVGALMIDVPCDDPATLDDVNTPADLGRLQQLPRKQR